MTKLWPHQIESQQFCRERRGGVMLAAEMGTGKSAVAISLVAEEGHRTILVLCPKSVLGVWPRELARHWPDEHVFDVLVLDAGTAKHKATRVDAFIRGSTAAVKWVVVNYESAWRAPLADVLLRVGFACVIADESHRAKAPGGKASKWMQRLGRTTTRRLCLTGTPMPHSPLDLYGQFRFAEPMLFGTSFAAFRARYAICDQMFPSQVRQWINQEDLQRRFHSRAYVCRAKDVLDLPETIDVDRTCLLGPKTRRVYTELEKEMVSEVEHGTVTAANALAKLLRLQQVTSGFVGGTDAEGDAFVEELGHEKESLLADILEDLDRPAVVFCRFRRDLDAVERVTLSLRRRYGELSGRRRDLLPDATMPDVDVFGVQIQSGGVGVDLTRASTAIYYSLGYSLGDYLQSRARLHRPGQKHNVTFVHLVAAATVDQQIYKALSARQQVVEAVISSFQKGKENGSDDEPWNRSGVASAIPIAVAAD